jgi:hypothetical protein
MREKSDLSSDKYTNKSQKKTFLLLNPIKNHSIHYEIWKICCIFALQTNLYNSMEKFKEFIQQMIEIIEHLVMWVKNRRRATHAI